LLSKVLFFSGRRRPTKRSTLRLPLLSKSFPLLVCNRLLSRFVCLGSFFFFLFFLHLPAHRVPLKDLLFFLRLPLYYSIGDCILNQALCNPNHHPPRPPHPHPAPPPPPVPHPSLPPPPSVPYPATPPPSSPRSLPPLTSARHAPEHFTQRTPPPAPPYTPTPTHAPTPPRHAFAQNMRKKAPLMFLLVHSPLLFLAMAPPLLDPCFFRLFFSVRPVIFLAFACADAAGCAGKFI